MASKLPSQVFLNKILRYDHITGKLYWLYRPRYMFRTHRAYKTWNSRYANKEAFTAIDRKGYAVGAIFNRGFRAHRIIYKIVHGHDPVIVDHDDRDTLNNNINNLNSVSSAQNQRNMAKAINNTSGYTGVVWDKRKQKWTARINYNGKQINLGRFVNTQDAVIARKAAEKLYNFHINHGN